MKVVSADPYVRIVHDRPGYAIGTIGHVVVVVTREPPSVPGCAALAEVLESTIVAEGRLSVVVVAAAPRPKVDRPVMGAIVRTWKRFEHRVDSAAVVIRSQGFIGSIQRSLVTMVMNSRRTPVPAKVLTDVARAAEWIHENDRSNAAPKGLAEALTRFVDRTVPSSPALLAQA